MAEYYTANESTFVPSSEKLLFAGDDDYHRNPATDQSAETKTEE